MRKFVYFWAAVLAVNVLMMGVAVGADLPRSGKFTIHSGFKLVGETTQVAEKHTFTYGGGWGVTYNDTGEGPLHLGSVLCSLAMEVIDTAGAAKGQCAWGDADSDKIFTDWHGPERKSSRGIGLHSLRVARCFGAQDYLSAG